MRGKLEMVSVLALILATSTIGGSGKSSQQSQDRSAQQSQSGMMHQSTMGGGMMGMVGQMTSHHHQMTALMNKLTESMTAIQNEKDPAALKARLADHATLLKQMHDEMMQQSGMMQRMSGQIKTNCPAAVDNTKP